jgi:AbrB family looped-hinge helix DNA binding protein
VSKVTSKLQVTIPKALATQFGIEPGDRIEWVVAGDSIRVVLKSAQVEPIGREQKLRIFDAATKRQRQRQKKRPRTRAAKGRGWTREELYGRGRSR